MQIYKYIHTYGNFPCLKHLWQWNLLGIQQATKNSFIPMHSLELGNSRQLAQGL